MPALAEVLGVSTPALYRYFASREELLEALAESVIEKIPLPSVRVTDWKEWVREIALATRSVLVRQPDLAGRIRAGAHSPSVLRLMDREIAVLTGNGFSDAEAVRIHQLVTHYVYRACAADARHSRRRRTFPPEFVSAVADQGRLALPHLARIVEQRVELDADEAFARNLDDLLAGIEAGRQRPRSSTRA